MKASDVGESRVIANAADERTLRALLTPHIHARFITERRRLAFATAAFFLSCVLGGAFAAISPPPDDWSARGESSVTIRIKPDTRLPDVNVVGGCLLLASPVLGFLTLKQTIHFSRAWGVRRRTMRKTAAEARRPRRR